MNHKMSLFVLVAFSLFFTGCQSPQAPVSDSQEPAAPVTQTAITRPMDGQDSFGLNVCEEVPKAQVEAVIGKPIEATEDKSTSDGIQCTYYTNQANLEHILIKVTYLPAENQKEGQAILDRTITTDPAIPMDHFIAMQADGQINAVYLVMTPNKYVRVDRTVNAADNQQLIALAAQVARTIIGQ